MSDKIYFNSHTQNYNKANSKIEMYAYGSEEILTVSLNQSDKKHTSLNGINEAKIGLKDMNENCLDKLS